MSNGSRQENARRRDRKVSNPARLLLEAKPVTLACGHETTRPPAISNPARWWHCNAWQRQRQGQTKP